MSKFGQILNAASLRLLTPTKLKAFIARLTKEEVTALDNDWSLWARPEQLPPGTDWSLWIMLGGRGSGKTRAGAEWVRMQMEGTTPLSAGAASRCALVADTIRDAREVMVEGVSGILSLSSMRKDMRPVHEPSRQRLVWPNGAIAQYYSAEDPDSLRGAQFSHAWLDEFCKWRQAEDAWDMLQFGLRLGARPRQVITSTPRPLKLLKKLMAREDAVTTMMRTLDNRANLPPSFFNQIVKQYEGTRLGRQELEGEILEDNVNGLWQREQIEHCRVLDRPKLKRIIVAVDPAVTSGKSSDECGIIIAGIDVQDQIYVLADRSIARAKPTVWAGCIIRAYHDFNADRVVAEVNQGGELVQSVIGQMDKSVSVKSVHASRGKWVRAEPVAALYEQNRVHHVGVFRELEDQLCAFDPSLAGNSYDRLDALVWACTDLALGRSSDPRIYNL